MRLSLACGNPEQQRSASKRGDDVNRSTVADSRTLRRRVFGNHRADTWILRPGPLLRHGSLILPPPRPPGGNPPVSPAAAPAPGNTIEDDACRRNSCNSRTARSTPTFAASP